MKNLLLLAFIAFSPVVVASSETRAWPSWPDLNLFGMQNVSLAQWSTLVIILFLGIVVRFFVRFLVARQLVRLFSSLKLFYLESLLKRATTPLGNLCMAGVWALFVSHLDLDPLFLSIIQIGCKIFACLSLVTLVYRAIDIIASYIVNAATDKDALVVQLLPLFSRASKVLIFIVGGLFILQNLHVNVTSLLAGMTLGGLAFSFAAKDAVANMFGSVTIFADQSFKVGDTIRIGAVEGAVQAVGFRATRVKTPYNSIVTIPNSKFTDSFIDNLSSRDYRMIQTELSISLSTSPEKIDLLCARGKEILENHHAVKRDDFNVYFKDYSETSWKIAIKFHLCAQHSAEENSYRHQILLAFLKAALELRIELPPMGAPWDVRAFQKTTKEPARESIAAL